MLTVKTKQVHVCANQMIPVGGFHSLVSGQHFHKSLAFKPKTAVVYNHSRLAFSYLSPTQACFRLVGEHGLDGAQAGLLGLDW